MRHPVECLKLTSCWTNLCRFLLVVSLCALLPGCGHDSLKAGREFMAKGEFTSAVIEFKNAVQSNSESVEARVALADALERTFDEVGAEQSLRNAINAGGDSDKLLPRVALLLLDRNDTNKLINEFKDQHLTSADAESNLRAAVAVAYLGEKQLPLAEKQLAQAKENTALVSLAKAQLLLAQGNKLAALTVLDTSMAGPSSPWWVLRGLARIYEANGNREQASKFMARAYEAAPWHRGVMGEYGEFLIANEKLDEAIVIRDRLKRLAPGFYWTHYVDALVLSKQGRSEASLAAALKVLAVSPQHLPATLLVASAELQKGDVTMANSRLKKIVSYYPTSIPLAQLMAESQLRLGKTAEAAETLKKGLAEAPGNSRLLSLRAESEVARGSPKEAIATLAQLSANDPINASYLLRLSQLQAIVGNKDSARKNLERATELGKNNSAIFDRVITIYLGMGDTTQVRRLADYAIQTRPKNPQSHLTLAAALGLQKDPSGSWRETLTALDIQPTFQPALNALTMLAKTPKQREELVARYEKAIQAKPTDDRTYLDYAKLLKGSTTDRTAITTLLEQGVNALPTSTTLREALVQEYFRAGKPEAALTIAQTGASANNALPDAIALLASVYERVGDIRLATETYRKLVTNFPQRTDWRYRLADLEMQANRAKEATTLLRALITERPFDPKPYIVLANMTQAANPREALSIAHELGEKESNKLTAMLLEGDLLEQSGQTDEAMKLYSKAEKAGALPTALLRNIQLLDKTKRVQAADEEMAAVMRKFPSDLSVIGFSAQRFRAAGNPAKAAELLQKIADKNPLNPFILNDLAWAQVEAKKVESLKNAEKAAELAPDSPEVLDTLGMAQALAGKQTEAIVTLRTAVNLAPMAPTPKLHLIDLYIASDNRKDAGNLIKSIDPKKLGVKDQQTLTRLTSSLAG